MYQKVLVTLDGSELAECALPHVVDLAKEGSLGEVLLLKVVEMQLPFAYASTDDFELQNYDFQSIWNDEVERSQKYLAGVKSRLGADGIMVQTKVLKGGRAPQAILDYAQKHDVRLIIIATHGYTGMKKLLLGSVAFRVLQESHVPVLLIRPESCRYSED